jgi:hypothetical protein
MELKYQLITLFTSVKKIAPYDIEKNFDKKSKVAYHFTSWSYVDAASYGITLHIAIEKTLPLQQCMSIA